MRILFALVSFVVATALLGFITTATIEGITEWGVSDFAEEIFGYWYNAAVFAGCVVFGFAFLFASGYAFAPPRPNGEQ